MSTPVETEDFSNVCVMKKHFCHVPEFEERSMQIVNGNT